jgi:hypothetical protein
MEQTISLLTKDTSQQLLKSRSSLEATKSNKKSTQFLEGVSLDSKKDIAISI